MSPPPLSAWSPASLAPPPLLRPPLLLLLLLLSSRVCPTLFFGFVVGAGFVGNGTAWLMVVGPKSPTVPGVLRLFCFESPLRSLPASRGIKLFRFGSFGLLLLLVLVLLVLLVAAGGFVVAAGRLSVKSSPLSLSLGEILPANSSSAAASSLLTPAALPLVAAAVCVGPRRLTSGWRCGIATSRAQRLNRLISDTIILDSKSKDEL